MKALRIFIALCLIVPAFSAWGAENKRGEVLAVLKTPAGMTLTEESLKSGRIRRYIDLTAESAGATAPQLSKRQSAGCPSVRSGRQEIGTAKGGRRGCIFGTAARRCPSCWIHSTNRKRG